MTNTYSSLYEKKSLKQLKKKLKYAKENYYSTLSPEAKEKMEYIKLMIVINSGKSKNCYIIRDCITEKKEKRKQEKIDKKIEKERKERRREKKARKREKRKREREEKQKEEKRINDTLLRLDNEFQSDMKMLKVAYIEQLYKECGHDRHLSRQIISYFSFPNEKLYKNLIKKYSVVYLKNIKKTMLLFNNLPLDIIKIIWNFYYDPNYKNIGILIKKFKKSIEFEEDMYNMKIKLYC